MNVWLRRPAAWVFAAGLVAAHAVFMAVREDQRHQAITAPLPAVSAAHAAHPAIEVYFSPHGGCTEALVDLIGSAKRTVRVQAYSFTSDPIADALIAARERGVDVAIVLDEGQRKSPYSVGGRCAEAGIPVSFDHRHAIAHNKVTVVDGKIVATGSFNMTASADASNAENLTIIRDAGIAAKFEHNWAAHREHAEP